jgi:tRNA (cmo5U34)-methyltransferase
MSDRESSIREHFDSEAPVFDELILALIPDYREMVAAVIMALPFPNDTPLRVLDLGCGTGAIAHSVALRYPGARLTCLDVADAMIASARQRLSHLQRTSFVVGDFARADLGGPYEAIVSSLALHHLETDADKLQMYRRIAAALAPRGIFANADVVLGGSDCLRERYIDHWSRWMAGNVGWDTVRSTWLPKYEAEDRPARLINHLDWLQQVGLVDIDVVFKRWNFAVWTARKAEA